MALGISHGRSAIVADPYTIKEVLIMIRFASLIALTAFLTFGIGTAVSFAGDPAPVEQKDKKDVTGPKADEGKKKDEKKDMGGK
jgi:hypothetical protein